MLVRNRNESWTDALGARPRARGIRMVLALGRCLRLIVEAHTALLDWAIAHCWPPRPVLLLAWPLRAVLTAGALMSVAIAIAGPIALAARTGLGDWLFTSLAVIVALSLGAVIIGLLGDAFVGRI